MCMNRHALLMLQIKFEDHFKFTAFKFHDNKCVFTVRKCFLAFRKTVFFTNNVFVPIRIYVYAVYMQGWGTSQWLAMTAFVLSVCYSLCYSLICIILVSPAWSCFILCSQCPDHWEATWKENNGTEKGSCRPGNDVCISLWVIFFNKHLCFKIF